MGLTLYWVLALVVLLSCVGLPAVPSAAALVLVSRPAPVVAGLSRRWPPWPVQLARPSHEPFLVSRRSRVPAVLPWRRVAAAGRRAPPGWPDTAAMHGKDVHWPALRQDGFMLHHAEVNRGHHHRLQFGAQPAETGLIDMMML